MQKPGRRSRSSIGTDAGKVKSFFLFLLFMPLFASSQLVIPAIGEAEDHYNSNWLFGSSAVKQHKVRSITAKVSVKHDLKTIRRLGLKEHYLFDKKGKLVLEYQTVYGHGNKPDTLPRFYEYNSEGVLRSIRTKDAYGFLSYLFHYSDGLLQQKEYWREEQPTYASLGKSTSRGQLVKTEKYKYEQEEAGLKRIYLNENNVPYQEEFLIMDEKNRLQEKSIRLKVAGGSRTTKYKYTSGRLIEKQITSTYGKAAIKSQVYVYDEQNRLSKIRYYKDTRLQQTTEFVYDQNSGFLKAKLVRDEHIKAINIIEYTYTFW